MGSTVTDRITGLSTSVAIKAPVQAITQGDITLYGLDVQAGGGWAESLVAGNRVLVKDQSNAVENGIYIAHSTGWRRARDFNGYRDIVQGTAVPLASTGDRYRVISEDPIIVGSSEITFQLHPDDARVTPVTSRSEMKTYDVPAGYQFSLEGSVFVFRTGDQSSHVAEDTKEIFWVAPDSDPTGESGAFERIFKGKHVPIEWAGGLPGDSSSSAKTANEEALAAVEALNYQPLLCADSSYHVSFGYDVWQHRFVAGSNVALFVDAAEYNVSNAVWGIYRIDDFGAGQNEYVTLRNAKDDIVIARIARGDQSSASHVFQLPLDIRRDSHSLISQPGTAGGTSDLLFRDSDNNDQFYILTDTTNKNLDFLYNTTVPPAFNFDVAMRIPTETTIEPVEFQRLPVKTAIQEFVATGNSLGTAFIPGGNRAVGVVKTHEDMPYTQRFIEARAGATYWHASGVLEVSFVSNTGVYGRRRSYFEWSYDGSSSTQVKTDEVNTLPASVTATVSISAGDRYAFVLDFDDTAGDGTECVISAKVDFSYTAL